MFDRVILAITSGGYPTQWINVFTMSDNRKMSVKEVLAAARGEVGNRAHADRNKEGGPAAPQPSGGRDTRDHAGDGRDAGPRPATNTTPITPEQPATGAHARSGATCRHHARRGFLGRLFMSPWAIGLTAFLTTNLIWLLGLVRFMFPNVLIESPTNFRAGFPDDYDPGFVETRYKAKHGVWVVRGQYEGEQQIYALKAVCTHLGCIPYWLESEQKFKCPCHGSGFYIDGINFEGPAPRPLERFAIRRAEDGQIEVDKSRSFHQELGQWSDPASFLRV